MGRKESLVPGGARSSNATLPKSWIFLVVIVIALIPDKSNDTAVVVAARRRIGGLESMG
jgi:hypothetical protein